MISSPWLKRVIAFGGAILLNFSAFASDASPREHLSLDNNWKFHLGDDWPNALRLDKAGTSDGPASPKFNDRSWRLLNLPHDWAIELPFDRTADGSHGFKPVGPGLPRNSIGWYRRTFELSPNDTGKRIWLQFDGVYRDVIVWVNGWIVTHHESGYSSFRCDITDVVRLTGTNTLTVKVDASKFEGWFYEGAGIYRHVWLDKTAPVSLAPNGIFVSSEFKNNIPQGKAKIKVEARVLNTLTNVTAATVKCEIISPTGEAVAKFSAAAKVDGWTSRIVKLDSKVSAPALWSPESPTLYKLVTTVEANGEVVDRQETEFGIRTVAFDTTNGFLLNGQHYELKGTCNHQDMAGVGEALPDALQYFRVAKLKEFGCNAYRTSHNPPTPELLEACDRLGMIVMDENRLLGSDEENLNRLHDLVVRDRNHPSVCIWSICNEEPEQHTPAGGRVGTTMQQLVQTLDPTRPITAAENTGDDYPGLMAALEVRGWNYHIGQEMDNYHAEHPTQPNVGTEQGSTVSTRGIYTNDASRGYVSAYDVNAPPWAHTAERWWSYFAERPWLSGGFVWTGFDYRGEPTPYYWPCINSHFGILDTCGFPKDNFYYYQSWWTTNVVLHLLPHWNWVGKEGQEIRVDALSNCQEVELFLNGQSLGRKLLPRNSKLSWQVTYAPGTLSAKGYNNGQVVAETKVETTGEAANVQLAPDRASIKADGEDVSVVTVSVTDTQGRTVPIAGNNIHFDLHGPGKILGVGNGDPSCHEPDIYLPVPALKDRAINDWRWKLVSYEPRALGNPRTAEYAANFDDSQWDMTDSSNDSQLSSAGQAAIFRQHVNLTEDDLNHANVQIHFGRIDDDGWVYVNGHRAGHSDNWENSPAFDIKPYLHVGDNIITVGVLNRDGEGGLTQGVSLEFIAEPTPANWSRSVFNGLAEVLVQSSQIPGEIDLTASGDGLQTGTVAIKTVAATPRPSVP